MAIDDIFLIGKELIISAKNSQYICWKFFTGRRGKNLNHIRYQLCMSEFIASSFFSKGAVHISYCYAMDLGDNEKAISNLFVEIHHFFT